MNKKKFKAIEAERLRIFEEGRDKGITGTGNYLPSHDAVYFTVVDEEAGNCLPKEILGVPVKWTVTGRLGIYK